MRNWILFLSMLAIASACQKTEDEITPIPYPPTKMSEMTVDQSFNWSSSEEGVLNVQMQNISDAVVSTEGEILLLVNSNDQILARSVIRANKATFNLKLPAGEEVYYLMYPNSANKQALSSLSGQVTMNFAPSNGDRYTANRSNLVYDRQLAYQYFNKLKPTQRGTQSLGSNLVQNGEFNIDNMELDARHWTNLRTPGKWYYTNSQATHPIYIEEGNLVYQNYNFQYEVIEQSFAVLGGSQYYFSMDYGNTNGGNSLNLWLDNFNAAGQWIGETHVVTNGSTVTSSGTILNNATTFQFYIGLHPSGWVDNVIYQSVDVNPDSDNDGVNDVGDDYPDDPTKAYKILYPTTGVQTISYEDLWPSTGDYDFNDLVISYNSEYAVDAWGNYVSATFYVDIDAAGGSVPLGLGIELLDGDKSLHENNIITSVSGNYSIADPDVQNGFIVFNNRITPMQNYYNNTDYDHIGTPVKVTCEVNLDNNFVGVLLPNIYAFRTEERGREIHLPGFPPTSAANSTHFGTYSDSDTHHHYKTANGLPWAIEIVQNTKAFKHPLEKIEITQAYGYFITWAMSSGSENPTWYTNKNNAKVFIHP